MKKITAETLTEIRYPSAPMLSMDGKKLYYRVRSFDPEKNCYPAENYIYENEITRKIELKEGDTVCAWLDAEKLLIARPFEGKTEFLSYDSDSFEEGFISSVPMGIISAWPLEDGSILVLSQYDDNPSRDKDFTEVTEIPFWGSGRGIFAGLRNRLYISRPQSSSAEALTAPSFSCEHVSVNGGTAVWSGAAVDDVYNARVGVYAYRNGAVEELVSPGSLFVTDLCCLPDFVILSASDRAQEDAWQPQDIFRYDFACGRLENINAWNTTWFSDTTVNDCNFAAGPYASADGDAFYFAAATRRGSALFLMDKKGNITIPYRGAAYGIDAIEAKAGHLVYRQESRTQGPELYMDGKRITHINDDFAKDHEILLPEYIPFTDSDGVGIDAWIIKPAGYEKGKKYPAILNIHGGPRCYYTDMLFHEMQMEAAAGYFVFFCNPRGSDGHGRKFGDLYGKYGTVDYEDIMEFTDKVLADYPDIDENRVGVCGGSYGGFMVNWIIGHTGRFAAACSQRSISDWVIDEYVSEIGYYWSPSEMNAVVDEDMETLWDRSPLKYAKNAVTPTLFIHSDEDYLCPIVDTAAMFTALKRKGVKTKFVIFHGENHSLSRTGSPKSRIKRLTEILSWFDRYLKQ